jgi:hypothetical protein
LAEVYWDLEWELQQAGFDYTYDKRLYDRLSAHDAEGVRAHLRADLAFQTKSARFLENHDEPRAAAVFEEPIHRAAAVIAYLVPGLRFFHEGQFDGRKAHVSMHLGRRPVEPPSTSIRAFYDRLLAILRRPEVKSGDWRLCECRPAWNENPSHRQFVAMTWTLGDRRLLAVSNYGSSQAQCYLTLPWPSFSRSRVELVDRLGDARYERGSDELATRGLYLDMPSWGVHVFELAAR